MYTIMKNHRHFLVNENLLQEQLWNELENHLGQQFSKEKWSDFKNKFSLTHLLEDKHTKTTPEIIEEGLIYQTIFHTSTPMLVTDSKGIVVRCNKAFEKLSGFHEEELVGSHFSELYSKANSSDFENTAWDKMHQGEFWEGKVSNIHQDGTLYECWLEIHPVFNHQHQIIYFVANYREHSSTDLITLAMLESTDYLWELLDITEAQILTLDSSFHIQAASKSFCRAYQLSESLIFDTSFFELEIGDWESESLKMELERCLENNGLLQQFSLELSSYDGKKEELLVSAKVIQTTAGDDKVILIALQKNDRNTHIPHK